MLKCSKCTQASFQSQLPSGSQKEKGSKIPVTTPLGAGWETVLLSHRKGVSQEQLHPVCAPLVISFPGFPSPVALLAFQIFLQIP